MVERRQNLQVREMDRPSGLDRRCIWGRQLEIIAIRVGEGSQPELVAHLVWLRDHRRTEPFEARELALHVWSVEDDDDPPW